MQSKTRGWLVAGVAAVAFATTGVSPSESAHVSEQAEWTRTIECVAHGSKADHGSAATLNARPTNPGNSGNDGGGGKKEKACFKTFASWPTNSVSVWVDDGNAPGSVHDGVLPNYVTNSLNEWSCHSGITFTPAGSAVTADIDIKWGNLGATGILGSASLNGFGTTITSATITMNRNQDAFTWTAGPAPALELDGCAKEVSNGGPPAGYDLLSVTIHEIGHGVGIDHAAKRCNVRDGCYDETMFPCTGSREWSRRNLNPGDEAAIESLYSASGP